MARGQVFGPYRIVRLLGRGGMGDVYEVEQVEQARRIALKVLSQRLTDPDDRARFLREGRLAASINHPHSVYIFGSEEIAGTPVIAMELLAGGTLKDRVREHGPLPPAEAVDAILQIIDGLRAAQAGGILHRDIKPANCFVDRDGTVKIGDFGLSISTMASDVTQLTKTGTFRGTPQFSAPEQLRGEQLDVRADIYAVGATLYYLLTGQPPFDGTDLMALLTRIATEVPRSPRALQPRVPRGLARIVVRCLAKGRAARPATYAALDQALRPYGSAAPAPATLGLRFMAGVIDHILLLPLNIVLRNWLWIVVMRNTSEVSVWLWVSATVPMAMIIAYYGIPEGLWGASIGKGIAGLRVRQADGQPAGMARALWRAVVFQTPSLVTQLTSLALGPFRPSLMHGASSAVLFGLLFSTMRRRNGFAAVHELASGTRTVRRPERGIRFTLVPPRVPARAAAGTGALRYGPYEVVGTLGSTDVGELLVGFDPSLRRHIWIHTLLPGAVAVDPLIRDLSRPGRLRWLNGRRSPSEAWDAYEALDGVPLVSVLGTPQPWRTVRPWLLDLALEIDAGLQDGSIATLSIDHVWITHDGYAKLLDFRAPGLPAANPQETVTLESAQGFLESVGRCALKGSAGGEAGTLAARAHGPLPLSATATLETLARREFTSSSDMVTRMAALLQGPDRVKRGRRAAHLCGLVPAILLLVDSVLLPHNLELLLTPNERALNNALIRVSSLTQEAREERAEERAALEVYIAGRFRSMMVTDPYMFTGPATGRVLEARRPLVERIAADHPAVSADEMTTATTTLGPFLRAQERRHKLKLALLGGQLALFALFGVWAFRGGLIFRAFGIAVVTGDGEPASRLRALLRGLAGWAWVAAAIWLWVAFGVAVGVCMAVLVLAGAAWAIVHPTRGLQDRIAGTWLVPR